MIENSTKITIPCLPKWIQRDKHWYKQQKAAQQTTNRFLYHVLKYHWAVLRSPLSTIRTCLMGCCGAICWYQWLSALTLRREAKPKSIHEHANMGPIWGWPDPGGPQVGPMSFAIWGTFAPECDVLRTCSRFTCSRTSLIRQLKMTS